MTSALTSMTLDPAVDEQIARVGPVDLVVALLTYNNAETARAVAEAAARGLEKHLPEARAERVAVPFHGVPGRAPRSARRWPSGTGSALAPWSCRRPISSRSRRTGSSA